VFIHNNLEEKKHQVGITVKWK